jgi:hypothetical protein
VQHVNLISGSLLCHDGYKLVFESNKCVLSKFGTFIGKGYESGGLFRLSLCESDVKYVNHINNHDEANMRHSWLCHINFGCMSRLVGLNLIPKFNLVKNSKYHVCVESKQPRKPHKAAAASVGAESTLRSISRWPVLSNYMTRGLSWFWPGPYVQQGCPRGTVLRCTVVLAEGSFKQGGRGGEASRSLRLD